MEQYRGDIFALLTACAWSVAIIFFKLSGNYLATVPLKVFQNVVAVALFFLTILILGEPFVLHMNAREWWLVTISAIIGITLGDTLFMAAINRLGASMQALVDGLYPPFVMILAFLFFNETLTLQVLLGAAVVICAISLAHIGNEAQKLAPRQLWVGLGFAVLSQLSMAICVVMVKDLLQTQPLLTLTAYRFLIGTVALIIFYWFRGERVGLFAGFRPSLAWRVTFTGTFLGPFLATLFWFTGFKYTLAGKAAVYNQLSTILIIILAALFLNERLTRYRIVAIFLALFGGYLVMTG